MHGAESSLSQHRPNAVGPLEGILTGLLLHGVRMRVRVRGRTIATPVRVEACSETELSWIGGPGSLFSGHHWFRLEANGEHTELEQGRDQTLHHGSPAGSVDGHYCRFEYIDRLHGLGHLNQIRQNQDRK